MYSLLPCLVASEICYFPIIRRVVLTTFRAWRRYPRLIQEEKERQRRLEEMRKKVSAILPDFDGVSFSERSTDLES